MRQLMLKLWNDDCGALISIEWVFVATILVLGVTIGLATVRNAAFTELLQFSDAVIALQQCYSFSGKSTTCGYFVCGSAATSTVPTPITGGTVPAVPVNVTIPPCN